MGVRQALARRQSQHVPGNGSIKNTRTIWAFPSPTGPCSLPTKGAYSNDPARYAKLSRCARQPGAAGDALPVPWGMVAAEALFLCSRVRAEPGGAGTVDANAEREGNCGHETTATVQVTHRDRGWFCAQYVVMGDASTCANTRDRARRMTASHCQSLRRAPLHPWLPR